MAGSLTEASLNQRLCKELTNEMYRDELYQMAKNLGLDVNKRTTKKDLCQLIIQDLKIVMNNINDLRVNKCIQIWDDEAQEFVKYRYRGYLPVHYGISDEEEVYLDRFDQGKLIEYQGVKYFLAEFQEEDELPQMIENESATVYQGQKKLHVFTAIYYADEEDEQDEKDDEEDEYQDYKYVADLHLLKKEGFLKCDNTSFDEFKIHQHHYLYNPYLHPDAKIVPVNRIKPGRDQLSQTRIQRLRSAKPYTILSPIKVDRGTHEILDGNHRLQFSKEKGYTHIPVIYV